MASREIEWNFKLTHYPTMRLCAEPNDFPYNGSWDFGRVTMQQRG